MAVKKDAKQGTMTKSNEGSEVAATLNSDIGMET